MSGSPHDEQTVLICPEPCAGGTTAGPAIRKLRKRVKEQDADNKAATPVAALPVAAEADTPVDADSATATTDDTDAQNPLTMLTLPRHNFSSQEVSDRLGCLGMFLAVIAVACFLISLT